MSIFSIFRRMHEAGDIHIKGAREHNLRNLELRIPRGKLVVITGVSGSGKSSLAFDTLYAEGYRKYIESLSVRARSLLEQMRRPDVDFIHGLSPVIAIEQRTGGGGNPRSTVGTVTEIADYARLLWSVCGEQFDPVDGGRIVRRSLDDCIARLLQEPEGARCLLLAPVIKAKASVIREELPRLRQKGFQRVRLDGEVHTIDELEKFPSSRDERTLEVVVDRVVIREDQRSRVADSLELALSEGGDRALALVQDDRDAPWREIVLSRTLSGESSGVVYDALTPRHFSWNHAEGACETCGGVGRTNQFQPELIVPDSSKSTRAGAIKPWRIGSRAMIIKRNAILKQLAEQLPFDPQKPWAELPENVREQILHGTGDRLFSFKLKPGNTKPEVMPFSGVIADLEDSRRNSKSEGFKARLMQFQTSRVCPDCKGQRLNARARSVRVKGIGFADFMAMDIEAAAGFAKELSAGGKDLSAARDAISGLRERLEFLLEVGLGYLTLDREYASLSGGEAQRVRLATQLGMGLVGVCYVLDEPSIGLHPIDNKRLIETLLNLRNRGNAVIVVEHDAETMRAADELIELGPGAGSGGGKLVFQGSPNACMANATSGTGPYLSGKRTLHNDAGSRDPMRGWLTVIGAEANNLQQVDVSFPVGLMTVVCGVSGSGKSTLVNDILGRAAAWKLNGARVLPGKHKELDGLDAFKSIVRVDQSPIGRTPRSNPATYTKIFDHLRDLYAKCPLAKVRGYTASRFSFNTRGGRCERCQGDGQVKLDMQFLGDVYVDCPSCGGARYNRETLEVRFKGINIAEALNMTVNDAMQTFRAIPKVHERLKTLAAVGLGYIRLGQSANTLSGGEAQRIKLALELSKRQQGQTLYLLDEPTTGLHWEDIQRLMDLLFQLRDAGNTIIIIEHHSDVIRLADWLIEMGPGGGKHGGELVYAGPVKDIKSCDRSVTAPFV